MDNLTLKQKIIIGAIIWLVVAGSCAAKERLNCAAFAFLGAIKPQARQTTRTAVQKTPIRFPIVNIILASVGLVYGYVRLADGLFFSRAAVKP